MFALFFGGQGKEKKPPSEVCGPAILSKGGGKEKLSGIHTCRRGKKKNGTDPAWGKEKITKVQGEYGKKGVERSA